MARYHIIFFVFPLCLLLVTEGALTSGTSLLAQDTLTVFADLDQSGHLSVQVPGDSRKDSRFVIVAPLTEKFAESEPAVSAESMMQFEGRLGRLKIEASPNATLTLKSRGCEPGCLKLFQKTDKGWSVVRPIEPGEWQLGTDATKVVEAGVGVRLPDASDDSESVAWPTTFSILVDQSEEAKREVFFRVAPFLIPGSLDPAEEVLVVSSEETREAVADLKKLSETTGISLTVHEARSPVDQWMQDTIEPGVFAVPGKTDTLQCQAVLSGVRAGFGELASSLDREVTTRLDQCDIVTLAPGLPRRDSLWIDWFGNLEVTPPHSAADGREFPYGRLLTGKQNGLGMHPAVMKFLETQAIQWPPIIVDTSWLVIGHIDEVVNFVPSSSARGYKVVLPSPAAARKLLESLVARGHGDLAVFAESRDSTTVEKLLKTIASSDENQAIDQTILSIQRQLAKELRLEENDFVHLPVLFEQRGAVIPNAVNSVVANGHFIAPEPRGPKLGNEDLFEEAIRLALKDCSVKVHFVDAWRAYHVMGGEIHCGTNTFRRLRHPQWWKQRRLAQ